MLIAEKNFLREAKKKRVKEFKKGNMPIGCYIKKQAYWIFFFAKMTLFDNMKN